VRPVIADDELAPLRRLVQAVKDGDGAAEGGYQIILLWPKGDTSSEEEGSIPDRFLGWYTVAHTKLTAQIKAGANELPPIKVPTVKGPPGKIKGVPGRN
jgi:hypothetical protein